MLTYYCGCGFLGNIRISGNVRGGMCREGKEEGRSECQWGVQQVAVYMVMVMLEALLAVAIKHQDPGW